MRKIILLFLTIVITGALPAQTNSIFQPSDGPVLPISTGPPVELGVKFKATQGGSITGIQYYKGSSSTGIHIGNLWTSTGTLLASAVFTSETATGWQKVFFTTPVPITAGVTYVASYFSPSGEYSYSSPFFTSAVVNGPLRALANGEDGPNGVYNFTATSAFPANGFNKSNYWVDVIFAPSPGPDMDPPVILSTAPSNAATGVSTTAVVTVTFNEPIDPATINNNTFELRNPSNTLVPAVVSYNAATYTATLAPAAALLNATLYSVVIKGGTTGPRVKDAAGNALAANQNWSFTTIPVYTPNSIFQPTDAPVLPVTHGGSPVELGVKFKTTQAGFITGIQYYKSTGATGMHTGTLWTSTGTLLASATFTGETASGWQKAYFAAPILITNGITYVASYFSASGDYSFTYPYFTSAVVNGPLRALADGEEGANGVYTFAATSSFPVNGFNSSNYWVDVVYTKSPDNIGRIFPQPDSSAGQLTVSVFPNPVSSYSWFNLKMKGNNSKPVTIKVFDVSGRVVQVVEKPVPAGLLKIGQTWSAGIYFAEVTQGNQRKVVKMIKMN